MNGMFRLPDPHEIDPKSWYIRHIANCDSPEVLVQIALDNNATEAQRIGWGVEATFPTEDDRDNYLVDVAAHEAEYARTEWEDIDEQE